MEYKKKQDQALLFLEKLCSNIVDGADHSLFGLAHFATKSKDERVELRKFN